MNKQTRTELKQIKQKQDSCLKRISAKSKYRHCLLAVHTEGYIPRIGFPLHVTCIKKAPKRRYNTILRQRRIIHGNKV